MTNLRRIITGGIIAALLAATSLFSACSISDTTLEELGLVEESSGNNNNNSGSNSWTSGSLTSSVQSKIYYFSASSYTSYTVYWDDSYSGSGSTTVDVKVTASTDSSFSSTLWTEDSGYSSGKSVYLYSSGYVYLKVFPYTSGNTGSFKICVKDSSNNYVTLYAYSDSTTTKSYTVSGSFNYGNGENIYKVYAYAGSTYTVSWTNTSGTIAVTASSSSSFSSGSNYFSSRTTSPQSGYISSSGYVYIKVVPYSGYDSNAGSFSLTVSTTSSSASNVYIDTVSTSAGSATTTNSDTVSRTFSYGNAYAIYTFTASAYTTYSISWTNSGSSYVTVSAGNSTSFSSSSSYFYNKTSSPQSYYNSSSYSRTVYVKVAPYGSYDSNAGSFTLTVSTTSSSASTISLSVYDYSYGSSSSSDSAPYTSGAYIPSSYWTSGYVSGSSSYVIYDFYASSSGTYYIYWDDSYAGSSTQTVDIVVYTSIGSTSFSSSYTDSGYYTPKSITLSSSGYVYIKVKPYSSGSGSFKICAVNSSGTKQTLYTYSSY